MVEYYNENVAFDIDPMIYLSPFFDDWYRIVKSILLSKEFQKRKLFFHHYNTTVWEHSIKVSFKAYRWAKVLGVSKEVCAIAGLLHDFYPDAWIYNEKLAKIDNGMYLTECGVNKPLFKRHGFVHAAAAAQNYVKFFPELENKKVTDSIRKHMFPLNFTPPKYAEGYVITIIDKIVSFKEIFC